jgi:2-phosphoglycolate phosphatase
MMDWVAKRMGLSAPPTRAERDAYQLARVRDTITHARANSPFYRTKRRWPDTLPETWEDIARIPFTWPEDLARSDPPLVAAPRDSIARMVTLETSGTTGHPKRIAFTAEDIADTIDYFQHGMAQFTHAGDRVGIVFPASRSGSIGQGLAEAARRLGATPLMAPTGFSAEALAAWIERERPEVLFGLPVPFLAAARLSVGAGRHRWRPRAVLVSADHTPTALARALQDIWGCATFNHWGMTETGYGGALECPVHDGAHIRETDLYLEIVDPLSGSPLPLGAEGEVVLTTLRRTALPLIRYRTGDLGCLVDSPCSCGSVLRRLRGPTGRIGATLSLADGLSLSRAQLDEALFSTEGVTDYAAVLETAPNHASTLRLTVGAVPASRAPALVTRLYQTLLRTPTIGSMLADRRLHSEISLAETCLLPHGGKRLPVQRDLIPWPRAILFDLDGTLVHSLPAVHAALNDTLEAFGMTPLPLDAVAPLLGGGAAKLLDRATSDQAPPLSAATRSRMVDHYVATYSALERKLTTPRDAALEALRHLRSTDRKIAVVTNKGTSDSKALLADLGLAPWVDAVVGGDQCPSNKPDPDPLFLACRRLGVNPQDALFVGDGREDLLAARAAGIPIIQISQATCRDQGPSPIVGEPTADGVIETLADLPSHFSSLEAL